MTQQVIVDDVQELQRAFATAFETRATEVIARREKCIVALSGGSLASTFLPVLAALAIDWTRIEFFWIDERAVTPDHPDSNYALASRLLLTPARVPAARVHRMHGELPDLEQAARRATDELKSIAGDPPRLDLALVGVGDDGHVASIFTGGTGLQPCPQPVIPVYDAPKPPPRRLTLTLPVLTNAAFVIVAALGESKASVMRDALENRGGTTPIAELLRRAPAALVLLDRAAGLS